MNHLKLIHQYLKERAAVDAIPSSGYPFVTIAREAGAGGHLLAHVITTDFLKETDQETFGGWHVFDKELCEVVANDPELRTSMETLVQERYETGLREFVDSLFLGRSEQYTLIKRTFQVVRMLALIGKVIIVGRAAALVTRDLHTGIHIRLVAPEASRVRWMMKKLHLQKEEARKLAQQQDAERRKLGRTFFDRDLTDPVIYDAVFNSDRCEPHAISNAVIELIRRRAARSATQ